MSSLASLFILSHFYSSQLRLFFPNVFVRGAVNFCLDSRNRKGNMLAYRWLHRDLA
jgi:hypothetical protein